MKVPINKIPTIKFFEYIFINKFTNNINLQFKLI